MEAWEELTKGEDDTENHGGEEGEGEAFPVPFILLVAGYTLILMIDKVIFDNNIAY